jgi:hypothetical protein
VTWGSLAVAAIPPNWVSAFGHASTLGVVSALASRPPLPSGLVVPSELLPSWMAPSPAPSSRAPSGKPPSAEFVS